MRRTIALFRPGSGLLARTHRATLFIASDLDSGAAHDLLAAFGAAGRSGTPSIAFLRSMARVVATRDFVDVPAFACIASDDDVVHALVYGQMQATVRTTAATETLDAAVALTWVDRRIEGSLVEVSVGDVPQPDRAWYVTEGVVPAAGALVRAAELDTASPAAPAEAADNPPAPVAAAVEPPAPAAPSAPIDAEPEADEPVATSANVIDLREHRPAPDEPGAPSVPVGGDVTHPAVLPPPFAEGRNPSVVTLPPPPAAPEPVAAAPVVDDPRGGRSLTLLSPEVRTVAGVQCMAGHLNRPDALRCQSCDAPLNRAAGTVVGPRPVLGTLVFDELGEQVTLNRPVVVGSAPPDDLVISGEDAVTIELAREGVSDIHFEVHLDSWDAFVIDRSLTGTFLDDSSGRRQRLPRHARVKLKSGTTIVFGTCHARFELAKTD